MIKLINADCMDIMKQYPDNYFDLAIVDPPYGIEIAKWDKEIPSKKYFTQLFRVSKNQIIWGGNYFNLPIKRGWLCWNKVFKKVGFLGKKNCEEFELAWTSLNIKTKIINFTDIGNMSGFDGNIKIDYKFKGKIHPTQKPIQLYKWLLMNYAKEGDKILDTHLGSGSSAIACHYFGVGEFVGIEIDKEYFKAAEKRIKDQTRQLTMF